MPDTRRKKYICYTWGGVDLAMGAKKKNQIFLDLNNFPSPLLPSPGCSWSDSVENFGHRMHLIRVQNFIKLLHGNKMNFIQSTFLSKLWFWPFLYNFCIILVKFNRTKHFLYNICIVVWLKSTKFFTLCSADALYNVIIIPDVSSAADHIGGWS